MGLLNDRPFINLVSGGFGSRVTVETDPELKRHLGGLAYVLTGISRFGELSANRGSFRAEGFSWEGPFVALRSATAGRLEAACHFARTQCLMTVCSI
jgi:diacylglycerol kinase family enzyme